MKKIIALVLLVVLLIPNIALAKLEDYATVIWEGEVSNTNYYNHIMKIRITIEGVIGEQISAGKANVHKTVLKGDTYYGYHYILPIVDGGSIKIEYLGTKEDKTYQDSEGTIADTGCYTIESNAVNEQYIGSDKLYVNKDFKFNVTHEDTVQYSELEYNNVKDPNLGAFTFIPPEENPRGTLLLQVINKSQALKMKNEIKKGHEIYKLGKFFSDPIEDYTFEMEVIKKDQAELENKYGVSITVENGFYPKNALLAKLDYIFTRFPDGLIKEITSYYKSKGINSKIKFQYRETSLGGGFSDKGGSNTVYFYVSPFAQFDDWTIAHEMGHYVHKYLNDRYGYNKLKEEWISLNNGFSYNKEEWSDTHRDYFVRDYSLTNYSEDFATIFELIAGHDPEMFRTDLLRNRETVIKEKVDLLNRVLIEKSKSVSSTKNLWGRSIPQTPSSYAVTTCEKAKEAGLIPDTDQYAGLYTSNITREDFCILVKTLIEKETNMTLEEFAKSKGVAKDWYRYESFAPGGVYRVRSNHPFGDIHDEDIFNLNALGVINGIGKLVFGPEGLLTREQSATILKTTAELLGKDTTSEDITFSDSSKISSWAKTGVDFVASKGLVRGTGNNNFSPKNKITYEQGYIILYNFYTKLK